MDTKIYFTKMNVNKWLWFGLFPIGPVFLVMGFLFRDLTDKDFRLVEIIFGFLASICVILYWLAVERKIFRRYVSIQKRGLIIKNHVLLGPVSISWKDIEQIDLKLFEPNISLRGSEPLIIAMEYDPQVRFREKLREVAYEKGIKLLTNK